MFPHILVLLLVLVVAISCISEDELQKYVKYVSDNVVSSTNYKLPANNSKLYNTEVELLPPKYYGSFDFIVIGAGSGGTVLTRRLTENGRFKVLLLEAGQAENNFTNIPAMSIYTRNSPYNWGYKTVPQTNACLAMDNRSCEYPMGKALGGSHVIGEMVYAVGNKADYDSWSEMGNKGWSYDEILKYIKKTEHDDTNDPKHSAKYHGYDGLLHINYTVPVTMNYEQYMEANKIMGLKEIDVNGESQIGIQRVPWTTKNNVRQTGGNAYIKPILNRKNLNVTLEAFVTELVIKNNTVRSVKFVKGNKLYLAKASKEVLLCAGSINTPQLLMISGIGPKEELKQLRIKVRKNLPVGKNFVDQPVYVGMYVRTNQTYPNYTLEDNLRRYLEGKTPLTAVFNGQHIAFINTKSPGQEPPNVEILTINPPMSVPPDLKKFYNLDQETIKSFSAYNPATDYLVFIVVMKPKSRGTVKLRSKSPLHFPLIDPNFYTDPNNEDIETMYEGVQYVLNMTNTAPLRSINATVIASSPRCEHLRVKSEKDYWLCAIKQLTSTIYHPTSSTRMGVSTKNSVVDANLKVHNMKNLRICDAGVIPDAIAGHTIAPVMMMAEKLADILKEEYA